MKYKFILSVVFILLTSNFIFSQKKIIELLVSDTLEIEAEEIIYHVTVTPQIHKIVSRGKSKLDEEKLNAIIASLEDVEEDKVDFNLSIKSPIHHTFKKLKIKGKKGLQDFYDATNIYPNASGNIVHLRHSEINSFYLNLTEKVIAKAKTKANHLAKLMDAQKVEIIEVSEWNKSPIFNTEQDLTSSNNWSENAGFQSNSIRFENTKIILTKKLKIKFSVN